MLTELLVSLRPRQWVEEPVRLRAASSSRRSCSRPRCGRRSPPSRSSAGCPAPIYLLNDVADAEQDRLHPDKRHRPVAAGRLSVPAAVAAAVVLIAAGLVAASGCRRASPWSPSPTSSCSSAYSVWLKHLVIVDVLVVAIGFVLRAVAGALAVQVDISGWLLICTILIALFLALGKRRHEY